MSIAVTGADGQLGHELCRLLGNRAMPLLEQHLDITSAHDVRSTIHSLRPQVLINTAAYTNVDRAEQESDRCFAVNVEGTYNLARVCQELGISLVQISTDYVFGGSASLDRPFREDDATNPENVYAKSKLESERVAAACDQFLIVRTCGLYIYREDQAIRNFAKTMLQLASQRPIVRVVDDQTCAPSYVPHVARAILFLVDASERGLFHVGNSGATTWCGFAAELFAQAGIKTRAEPIRSDEYPSMAKRPAYSVLDTSKYGLLGGPVLPSWQSGISDFLESRRGFRAPQLGFERLG